MPSGRDHDRTRLLVPVAGVTVVALWLFTLRIGSYSLVDGDAAFWGRIARNVAETGQWLVPTFSANPRDFQFDKPPVAIWLMAASFRALGPTEFAARLWHAILAVVVVAVTALFAGRRLGPRGGAVAGLVLATTGEFFYLAREPLLDVPLTLCVAVTIVLVYAFGETGRVSLWLWACASLGVGLMTKGPVALGLPAATLGVVAWWNDRSLRRLWPPSMRQRVLGALIVAALVVPWHLVFLSVIGHERAAAYLGTISWRRYLIRDFFPGIALPIYAGFLLVGALPWAGVLCAAIAGAARPSTSDRLARLALAWTLVPVAFFGLSPGPVFMRYLLPAFPGLALLVAWWLTRSSRPFAATAAALQVVLGVALAAGAFVVPVVAPAEVLTLARTLALLLGVAAVLGGGLLFAGRAPLVAPIVGAATCGVFTWLVLAAAPAVEAMRPERGVAAAINRRASAGACVASAALPAPQYPDAGVLPGPAARLVHVVGAARVVSRPRL